MSWGLVAAGVGTVIGGALSNRGSRSAARAQQQANQAGIDEQRRQFDLTRQDQMPWLDAGRSALGRLSMASEGNLSAFQMDPGYQFRLQQGQQGMDRGAAARGRLYSGGYDADRMAYNSGMASQEFGNWWGRQAELAGVGQRTASGLGQMGMGMASNIGNMYRDAGAARASSYQQQGNNWANVASGLGGLAGSYFANRRG